MNYDFSEAPYGINSEEYGFNSFVKIIPRFSEYYRDIEVPERFSKRVQCHVASLYINNNHFFSPPIFLAIEGSAGEGKTAQAIASCTQKGITVLYVSGSSLSGNHEADSKKNLEELYNRASAYKKQGVTVAIVIDDFHKSVANESNKTSRTINSDLLTGYMMNLAENTGGIQVPIILTANDLSDVYAPLLRLGRADLFHWVPRYDEKKTIIRTILKPLVKFSSENELDGIFHEYMDQPIVFFAQLKNRYRIKMLQDVLSAVDKLDNEGMVSINNALSSMANKVTIDDLKLLIQEQLFERV